MANKWAEYGFPELGKTVDYWRQEYEIKVAENHRLAEKAGLWKALALCGATALFLCAVLYAWPALEAILRHWA